MKRREREFTPLVVHTGQHYDPGMSASFFEDLDLPQPDVFLEVGSASHAARTAALIERFEPVVIKEKPDWVVVVGDVNSTLACALVCVKLGVKVAQDGATVLLVWLYRACLDVRRLGGPIQQGPHNARHWSYIVSTCRIARGAIDNLESDRIIFMSVQHR